MPSGVDTLKLPSISGQGASRVPYHSIIVDVSAMGSAVAFHLARGGQSVLALEWFDIPNAMGSSHGVTGFKFAPHHHRHEAVAAEDYDREPNVTDEAMLRAFAAR